MNLILAVMWLLVAVVAVALPWLDPDGRLPMSRGRSTLLLAGGALLLALYNLVRWWYAPALAADRRAIQEALARRRSGDKDNAPEPYRAPDPDFDFSDQPPK
jgi:hypothetical protein